MAENAPIQSSSQQKPGQQLLRFSGEQVQSMLGKCGDDRKLDQLAQAAGLSSSEIAALRSGAGLALTPEQHEKLKRSMAAAYAKGPGQGQDEIAMLGDTCGCSGSPTPTPTPTQSVPPVTGTHDGLQSLDDPGTELHSGSVGGGTVTLRGDVDYTKVGGAVRTGGFSIEYSGGGDTQNAHLLQMVWGEIIVTKDTGDSALTDSLGTTAGQFKLTTGGSSSSWGTPSEENWTTDTSSASDPMYEAGNVNVRTNTSTKIYDRPDLFRQFIRREFDNGATAIVQRLHFKTWLVQTDRVTYAVETNLEYKPASRTDNPAPAITAGSCGATSSMLPAAARTKFHSQFPGYSYIT